jgi:hypothetical protein
MLLADAVGRSYASAATVGSSMSVVDAINDRRAAQNIWIERSSVHLSSAIAAERDFSGAGYVSCVAKADRRRPLQLRDKRMTPSTKVSALGRVAPRILRSCYPREKECAYIEGDDRVRDQRQRFSGVPGAKERGSARRRLLNCGCAG